MKKHYTNSGFSLIELMIAVAIVGILTAIAYPSYTSFIIDARRTDGQEALMGFANAMERFKTENMTYVGAGTAGAGNVTTGAPAATTFPTQAPLDGNDKFYNLTIVSAASLTYTLRATPIDGTSQADDGLMEITSTGVRRWDQNNDDDTADAGETSW
ncbi:type IV pilin protein [Amphritea sp. HPY]|uniref:type IV pilin protein n=1 Tax=Amphritea sp. HPY TaxID=3421652 RepID=UPI003D7D2986